MDKTFIIGSMAFLTLLLVAGVALIATGVADRSAMSKTSSEPPFPVDVVCLWVDGTDALWRKQLQTHLAAERLACPDAGIFHSADREPELQQQDVRDELYYSAHSVVKFMPWVRKYYLVTMRPHKPLWWPSKGRMGTTKFVLVHHDQIFDGSLKLPTFNSNAIQRHISRIPGLAENFILFDDDCYAGQPLRKSDFFTKQGVPMVRMVPYFPGSQGSDAHWIKLCENTARLISTIIGLDKQVYFPAHVPLPALKTVWNEVVFKGMGRQETRQFKRFRSKYDFTVQYVMAGVMHGLGMLQPLPEDIETLYKEPGEHMDGLAPHLFCINHRLDKHNRAYLESLLNGP